MQISVGSVPLCLGLIFLALVNTHGLPNNVTSTPDTTKVADEVESTSKPTTKPTKEPTTTSPTTTTTTSEPTTRRPPKIRARLAAGRSPWEGRVEVSIHGGPYGTVCDDGFSMNAANVVCRMVGYKKAMQYFFGASEFGRGRGRILLDEISCLGTEKNLLACEHSPIGVNDCSHSEDVGIRCSHEKRKAPPPEKRLKKYKFRLVGDSTPHPISSGIAEVFMNGKWRTICSDGWDMRDARVLCGSLGFKDALSAQAAKPNKAGQRKKSMLMTQVSCTGKEHNVSACARTVMKSHKECQSMRAVEVSCERGHLVMDAPKPAVTPFVNSTVPSSQMEKPDVRLKAGAQFGEGRLEVFHDGHWGTVCGDEFHLDAATVVCRQLGFGTASEVIEDASGFGQGVGPIWLWDVECKGTESSIMECSHGAFNRSKCDHSQDLGIRCNIPDLGVKDEIRLVSGRFDTEGRVMIRLNGVWGHVCGGPTWDMADSMVACRQLGLGYAHQPMKSTRYMGRATAPILITQLNCTGQERSLLECPYLLTSNRSCTSDFKAGVLCANILPDVLLDVHVLQSSVYLQDWPTYLLQCAAEEGCLSSVEDVRGVRRLLRFSSAIMNRGTEEFRPVLGRSSWEWHACHRHFHSMEVFSHYDLLNHEGERVAEGHKASFCLEDVYCDSGAQKLYDCDTGAQGISVNCVDIYRNDLDCQWIDITRVPSGSYVFRIDVNPDHLVGETDYANNEVVCDLYISRYRARVTRCRYADDS